jgi:hypothetical protein
MSTQMLQQSRGTIKYRWNVNNCLRCDKDAAPAMKIHSQLIAGININNSTPVQRRRQSSMPIIARITFVTAFANKKSLAAG